MNEDNIYSSESENIPETTELLEEDFDNMPCTPEKKPPKKVSLVLCIISIICVALAAVMVTYVCCLNVWKGKQFERIVYVEKELPNQFDVIFSEIFEKHSFGSVDKDEMMESALRAYVDATGDHYAEYYNAEEWKEVNDKSESKALGVGVNIIDSVVEIDGVEYKAFKVINVVKDSSAEGNIEKGDYIAFVVEGDTVLSVDELGYEKASDALKGEEGSFAKFILYRKNSDGEYEPLEFMLERKKITATSVYSRICEFDESIGIIRITGFNLKTPEQFSAEVDSLLDQGCDKFVFDVRNNLGGRLSAIESVLSYFLNEGDALIHTIDKDGNYETSFVEADKYISADEIGKYSGFNCVVLCNESTASAAELFTATLRDYGIATIVGTKTFGKGSVQTLFSLSPYGFEGGVKLTTYKYYSPSGDSYEGIGIIPDIAVELDESLKSESVYEIKDAEDNQLCAAIEQFK